MAAAERQEEPRYAIKVVDWFGRRAKVCMQTANGPCPLLAIANVLSLRNELKLRSGAREVTQSELITAIVDLLLERSKHYEAAYAADYQHNMADIFPVLQKLSTGVDVNVKFSSIHAFEATPEVAVFDLLGIPLVHGWLVDPEADGATAAAFGNKSYNELVELLFLVLGDEEMELLSTGPLRNLSITSHHHSFSNSVTGQAAAAAAAAAVAAAAAAEGQQQQQQQEVRTLSLDDDAPELLLQQQQGVPAPSAPPLLSNGSSSGPKRADAAADAADVESADADAVIESLMQGIVSQLAAESRPPLAELGESPTRAAIRTRQAAYEGAAPSRLAPSSADGAPAAAATEGGGPAPGLAAAAAAPGGVGAATAAAAAAAGGAAAVSSGSSQQLPGSGQVASAASAADAAVVREFMEAHCSQLTPYGLASVAQGLKEHQLAVFFRNNHFNALFKFEGAVFLLVTDQGYEYEPDIVWERLDSVNGDTTFCGPSFAPFVPHREAAAAAAAAAEAAGGGAGAAAGGPSNTDLDAAIAASLAAMPGGSGDEDSDAAAAAAVAAAAEHDEAADASLALALQLQEEEEVRARREREQQRQQQQRQQQQQTRQQQQQTQQQAQAAPEPLGAFAASMRNVGQRIASGVQQQYAATAAALTAQQQQQAQAQAQQHQLQAQQQAPQGRHHRPGHGAPRRQSGGDGRRSATEEKCSIM